MSTVSIFGAFTILASVRTKLCIFQKIRSRKRKTTIKTEEQSLTPQLGRKSSHAGSWVSVVRRWWWASWDIGHALVPRASQLHINVGGFGGVEEELGSLCSPPPLPPPQTDPPHLSTERRAWRWHLLGGGGGGADHPGEGIIRLQAVQLDYCCRFIIFRLQGYTAKRSDWKQGNAGVRGCTVHDGRGFTTKLSPVRWLRRRKERGR